MLSPQPTFFSPVALGASYSKSLRDKHGSFAAQILAIQSELAQIAEERSKLGDPKTFTAETLEKIHAATRREISLINEEIAKRAEYAGWLAAKLRPAVAELLAQAKEAVAQAEKSVTDSLAGLGFQPAKIGQILALAEPVREARRRRDALHGFLINLENPNLNDYSPGATNQARRVALETTRQQIIDQVLNGLPRRW